MLNVRIGILLLLFAMVAVAEASAQSVPSQPTSSGRYALVIGNSDYGGGDDDVSGANDADLMEKALTDLQFTVIKKRNADRKAMTDGLTDLTAMIKNSSVVVFFFSGHGFQNDQENYFVPARASADPSQSVSLKSVAEALSSFAPDGAKKLFILDACRKNNHLPEDSPQGFSGSKLPPLLNAFFAFAAGYDLTAPAAERDGFSPFTFALVNHIREPGLDLVGLLGDVHDDLKQSGQIPVTSTNIPNPEGFHFREAMTVVAEVSRGSAIVILNGSVVLAAGETRATLSLQSGENDLEVLVANPKAYHNGHTWDRTSGWEYTLELTGPDGLLNCSGASPGTSCFSDSEEVPFKDGPHHGNVFTVAHAKLVVDPNPGSTSPKLSLSDTDTKVWNRDIPFYAEDQELDPLIEEKVKDLPLDQILDPSKFNDMGDLSPTFLIPLFRELLTTGMLIGQKVADPERTFFVVRGNKALRDFVGSCVKDNLSDRLDDFRASVKAALNREPTPFKLFDDNLSACVKDAAKRTSLPLDDVKVWTAIEDRSDAPPTAAPPVATGQGGQP